MTQALLGKTTAALPRGTPPGQLCVSPTDARGPTVPQAKGAVLEPKWLLTLSLSLALLQQGMRGCQNPRAHGPPPLSLSFSLACLHGVQALSLSCSSLLVCLLAGYAPAPMRSRATPLSLWLLLLSSCVTCEAAPTHAPVDNPVHRRSLHLGPLAPGAGSSGVNQ